MVGGVIGVAGARAWRLRDAQWVGSRAGSMGGCGRCNRRIRILRRH